ncbi:hypothetical protein ENSA5_26190 [Enhygromyxa salina]|uniref:Uncharacterized protein n=1 Tax=Enhygromyxa salina TaxID=215803 RepID=A0A2S9YAM4_9BACT|nr:hypothetical protein [Enhygromyxa salina]PRQ02160.1 hypothetical protein ENSA5_26190 [Enhygromyxa salina]
MPPTKWYLNLPKTFPRKLARDLKKKNAGTVINLDVTAGGALAFAFDATVDWTVTYDGSPDADEDYVPAGPTLARARSPRHHNKFKNQLTLPMVTGRTYTVEARRTGHDDQVPLSRQYETWQRVYYTVHYMNQACRAIYDAIRPRITAIFAAANIELKERAVLETRVDELFTTVDSPLLPHLYRTRDKNCALDRAPCHIRMVIVNDLVDVERSWVSFEIDNTTSPEDGQCIRLSTRGDDHEIIVYENDTVVFDTAEPFDERWTKITASTPPIEVPDECVDALADHPMLEFEIDVDGDAALAYLHEASLEGQRDSTWEVTLRGSCRGRWCAEGWFRRYEHAVKVELTLANDAGNKKVAAGHYDRYECWLADGGDTLIIDDPRMVLAETAVQTITVTASGEPLVLDASVATRVSDGCVSIDLSGESSIAEALAVNENTGAITINVVRCGARANGDIDDETDHEFVVPKIGESTTHKDDDRAVQCRFGYKTRNLNVVGDKLLFAAGAKPKFEVEVSAAVSIAAGAWSLNGAGTKLEIDLSADGDLALAAAAMAAGRTVAFKGYFNWRQSFGGYNFGKATHFVALTTKKFGNWDDRVMQKRTVLAFCHEIGHALGLSPKHFRNYNSGVNEVNDRYYTDDQGGTGPHCHYNAELVTAGSAHGRPDTNSGQIWWPRTDGSELCIMYHTLKHDSVAEEFCPICLSHLKRSKAHFT